MLRNCSEIIDCSWNSTFLLVKGHLKLWLWGHKKTPNFFTWFVLFSHNENVSWPCKTFWSQCKSSKLCWKLYNCAFLTPMECCLHLSRKSDLLSWVLQLPHKPVNEESPHCVHHLIQAHLEKVTEERTLRWLRKPSASPLTHTVNAVSHPLHLPVFLLLVWICTVFPNTKTFCSSK